MDLKDATDLCTAILCKLGHEDRRRAFDSLESLDARPPGHYRPLYQLRSWEGPRPIEVGVVDAASVRWREAGTKLWNISTPMEFAEAVRRAASVSISTPKEFAGAVRRAARGSE